jgi:hypothetical protein
METTEKVKERPILFSTPMVQAILEGRKTVTRRVVKGRALDWLAPDLFTPEFVADPGNDLSPYGFTGDIAWVRETWRPTLKGSDTPPGYWNMFEFAAGGEKLCPLEYELKFEEYIINGKWKPSIHMPRVACRVMLKIKSISVERLHDITEEDAIREGIQPLLASRAQLATHGRLYKHYTEHQQGIFGSGLDPVESFSTLWEFVNGQDSWNSNPWVWRIEFEKFLNT